MLCLYWLYETPATLNVFCFVIIVKILLNCTPSLYGEYPLDNDKQAEKTFFSFQFHSLILGVKTFFDFFLIIVLTLFSIFFRLRSCQKRRDSWKNNLKSPTNQISRNNLRVYYVNSLFVDL